MNGLQTTLNAKWLPVFQRNCIFAAQLTKYDAVNSGRVI